VVKAVVICSHPLAAEAGQHVLQNGGNAVDAAVATALAITVVDPPNCTLTGYGGYMIVQNAQDDHAMVVDFNTSVPRKFSVEALSDAPRLHGFLCGASSVSVPGVPAGLASAHREFGTQSLSSLATSAIAFAEEGFEVGRNLKTALAWAAPHLAQTNAAWRAVFAPKGTVLKQGDRLVQSDLAKTLRMYSDSPTEFYTGSIGQQLVQATQQEGGLISMEDMTDMKAVVIPADRCSVAGLDVQGPPAEYSGFGILKHALAQLADTTPASRDATTYVTALQQAWTWRGALVQTPYAPVQHTNHFCVVDTRGMMVACTLTLGPLWFGSLQMLQGTGLVLNCGLNLIRQRRSTGEYVAVNNLTPVAARDAQQRRYVAGAPGGTRIPAVVMRLLVETALSGQSLQQAMDLPRIAVRPDGTPEFEALLAYSGTFEILGAEDFYGPASIVRRDGDGTLEIGQDPRFDMGVAWA
jgi:gamma-glutamyltranspeptidase